MRRRTRERGFSFLEIMVVVMIIGILMAIVAPRFMGGVEKAEPRAARVQVEQLSTALDMFRLDVGRYPTSEEGLQALVQRPFGVDRWDGPYLQKSSVPDDPWHNPFHYKAPGESGRRYDLYSLGADNAPGGDGTGRDITSWESDAG